MTVIPLRRRKPPPVTPAFGTAGPAGRRRRITVLVVPVVLLAAALGLRASGLLGSGRTDQTLPPELGIVTVAPGLVRGAQPSDVDLLRLRDDHGVRAVVDVDGMSAEEQATTGELGLRTLQLTVAGGQAPTAADMVNLVRFLRSAVAVRPGASGTGLVYLHDADGRGPVLITAAMLRVLRGVPAPTAVDELRAGGRTVTDAEVRALTDADALDGDYAVLRGESW